MAFQLIQHVRTRLALEPVMREFRHIAAGDAVSSDSHYTDDGTYTTLDYGGSLDEVLKARDAIARKHGCLVLGRWQTGSNGTTTGAAYVWVPFVR